MQIASVPEPAAPCWPQSRLQSACPFPARMPLMASGPLGQPRCPQPPLPKSAPSHDNEVLQFTTKTVSSAATNRLIETAIPENLPAEPSATQFGAIHDSLSHAPPSPCSGPWQLAERSRRQSSCFLPSSPGPCALPGHSLSHACVHEPPSAHASKRVFIRILYDYFASGNTLKPSPFF